jgi:type II secretory pathway pseudopilin PulG
MSLKHAATRADHPHMRIRMSAEAGYTLVELLVAAAVLVMGALGAFALLDGANKTTVSNNARMGATNLAREILEDARSLDYEELTPATMVAELQARPGMTGNGTPWVVTRRGINFTVEAGVCTFDDPKDGVAVTPPSNVCTPQAPVPAAITSPPTENQPDDFRRVRVKISWNTGAGPISMRQTAMVSNPSGGLGPRITKFDDKAQVSSGTVASYPTTSTTAASVRWNSDGTPAGAGDSTGGPTSWSTDWQLGSPATPINPPASGAWPAQYTATTVLDGTYTLTAQAFDDRGIAGDAKVAVLPLNRSFPLTVTAFELGRNTYQNTIDFSWNANPERDIVGYEVYNAGPDNTIGNGNDSMVCSTADVADTSCSDTSPQSGTPNYYVVALDRSDITNSSSGLRRSPYAQVIAAPSQASTPAAPDQPVLLPVALDSETGNPQLTWTHLNLGSVRFFRIYRDNCCTLADRYDSTVANGTQWVDPNPGNTAHRYWVTAVGSTLNESSPSNHVDSTP